jgi:hypothetical protein
MKKQITHIFISFPTKIACVVKRAKNYFYAILNLNITFIRQKMKQLLVTYTSSAIAVSHPAITIITTR